MTKHISQKNRSFTLKKISLGLLTAALLFTGCYENYETDSTTSNGGTTPPPATEEFQDLDRSPSTALYGSAIPTVIIGVNFADQTLSSDGDYWVNKIFGKNFGELNDYFQKSSEYSLYLTPVDDTSGASDSYIEVTLPYNHIGQTGDISDQAYRDFIIDVMDEALPSLDIETLDTNHNNILEQNELTTIVIVAGYEQSYEDVSRPTVWSHSYGITNSAGTSYLTYGSYTIGSWYALFGEIHKDHLAPIGIMAHELSHAILDLPDLYNTDTSNNSLGIGPYGLMGYGMWGTALINDDYSPGNCPSEYSAFSKYIKGMVTPTEIDDGSAFQNYSLNGSNTNQYNMLKVNVGSNQFFLLENRSATGYDEGMKATIDGHMGGVAIWHIDKTVYDDNFNSNTVNDVPSHKAVDFEEATTNNMDNGISPLNTDLYFFGNKTIFNKDTSTSNSRLYDGLPSGLSVKDISDIDISMTLSVENIK